MQKQPFFCIRKSTAISVTVAWFLGNALNVMSATDFFSAPFFQGRYLVLYYLMGFSTLVVIAAWYLSIKQRQREA